MCACARNVLLYKKCNNIVYYINFVNHIITIRRAHTCVKEWDFTSPSPPFAEKMGKLPHPFLTPSPPLPTTRVDSFRHVLPKRLAHTSRRRHCFLWRTPSPVKLGLHIRWAASMSSCSHLTKHPFASIWNTSFRSYQRLLFSTAIRRDRALAARLLLVRKIRVRNRIAVSGSRPLTALKPCWRRR